MNGLSIIETDSFWSVPIDPPVRKTALTALAITVLVIGLLGAAYAACGYTSLSHSSFIFKPLGSINTTCLSVMFVSWSVAGVGGIVALIVIHKRGKQPSPFESKMIEEFDRLKSKLTVAPEHVKKVGQFLESSYSGYLEYYGFYYHLSSISEHVINEQPELRDEWTSFLEEIHDTTILPRDGNLTVTVDCSMELSRLEGVKTSLVVEELKKDFPTIDQDLKAINAICLQAFSSWKDRYSKSDIPMDYFFGLGKRPFIIRNASSKNREVLSVIVLQDMQVNGESTLYIHSLARSAHAVKLGMTEHLKEHFASHVVDSKKYKYIWCQVLKDNQPAQYIYKKLGFKITHTGYDDFTMIYEPS